jgi:dTDP-4-amino-4,6-dideoxygalactose transaminase
MIFQNKPYITGKEFEYISQAINNRHLSGNGLFTQNCHNFFSEKYGFKKCLLTTSCTDALEMCALLLDIQPGDEVIMPTFTFVSTANAFVLRGAKIVLADSEADNPNIDITHIEKLLTSKTKAIVVVHYAGVSCNMESVMQLAERHNIFVIEDAAQAIDSFYKGNNGLQPLGGIGHLAAFSFHESKNIQCAEGGMLVINDERFVQRAEIIWEKGTNRAAFFRGEIDKYNWVDIGSSFLPSEINAAFLYAQLQHLASIQKARIAKWQQYYQLLSPLSAAQKIVLPIVPQYATNNAHIFYITCFSANERTALISWLKERGVQAMFHYPSLHTSPFYAATHKSVPALPNAEKFSGQLIRLPLYVELEEDKIAAICNHIIEFYK